MRFLTIDFDYFQKVTAEQLSNYPDGIDLPTRLSEMVWASRYAENPDLLNVGFLQDEFDKVCGLLKKQKKSVPVWVQQSHKGAYWIANLMGASDKEMDIVNIDMHHDFKNDNTELDCGNWIGHLANARNEAKEKTGLTWICNPVSKEMYGMDEPLFNVVETSVDSILDEQFDGIYICRSDNWLAPHLDDKFTELINVIESHFRNSFVDDLLRVQRNSIEQAKELGKAMRKFKDKGEER